MVHQIPPHTSPLVWVGLAGCTQQLPAVQPLVAALSAPLHCKTSAIFAAFVLQLDPWVLQAHVCPCHRVPMQPATNSNQLAAARAAAAAAASDADSMAALLLLPETCPWSCSISGTPVMAPLSSCPVDARILQLGRHTQLTMPSETATAASTSIWNRLQALPLAAGQACQLEALHMVHPSAVDSMLLYGMPLLLTPCAGSGSSDNQALGLLQDASVPTRDQRQGQQLGCLSASEAGAWGGWGQLSLLCCCWVLGAAFLQAQQNGSKLPAQGYLQLQDSMTVHCSSSSKSYTTA